MFDYEEFYEANNYCNIDCLPDEMLLEVFRHLDGKSLVNASKSNNRWKDVIASNVKLMQKVEYAIICIGERFAVSSEISDGKYPNLFIGTQRMALSMPSLPDNLMNNIKAMENSVRNVTLSKILPSAAVKVLESLKMTRKLILLHVTEANDSPQVELQSLEHLEVIESSKFMSVIRFQNLKILKINEINFNVAGAINQFLRSCKLLTELQVSASRLSNFRFDVESFEFKLTKLSLENLTISDENLLQLCEIQMESLKELSLVNKSNRLVIERTFEFIVNHLKLSTLEISLNVIQNIVCGPNESIKKLVIFDFEPVERNVHRGMYFDRDRLEDLHRQNRMHLERIREMRQRLNERNPERAFRLPPREEVAQMFDAGRPRPLAPIVDQALTLQERLTKFEKVFSTCEKLESLSIFKSNILDQVLQIVSTKLPQLKFLNIDKVPKLLNPTLNFDKLIRLEIDEVTKDDLVPYLVAYCGNIKVLKINDFVDVSGNRFKELIQKVFASGKNLKEVHLNFEVFMVDAITNIFQEMRYCGKKLQVIRLNNFKLMGKHNINAIKYESVSHFVRNELKSSAGALLRAKRQIEEKSINYASKI